MKRQVTPRSRKKDIWEEKARLERLVLDRTQRLTLLERERASLREENDQLRDHARFVERLRVELAELNEKLDLLTRLTKELASLNPEKIFDVCVTKIPYLLKARYASVYLYDEEKRKLHLKKHSHNRAIEHVIHVEKDIRSLMARVLDDGRVRIFGDLDRVEPEEGKNFDRPHASDYATRSCIIAPLKAGDKVLGVLNLADPLDGRPFQDGRDLVLMNQVSELLGISLRNYKLFEQIQRRAKTDSLTKLANHQTFFEELNREVTRAQRYGGDFSIVMIDVDRFKLINDNEGHLAGDSVLEEVAKIVKENVRTVDIAARYGGDEFALLLPEQDVKGALVVAQRVRERVNAFQFAWDGHGLRVHLSLGLAQFQKDETATEVVKAADDALFQAKRAGGDRVVARE